MVTRVNPQVNVIDYGPNLDLGEGNVITPDELVYGSSQIAYKDIGALQELIQKRKEGKDVREKMVSSMIRSAGSGHASMATTPVMWVFLEGNCSKLVDSIFTGVKYGSSLMPSGRRVPIVEEAIVVPHDFPISQENALVPDGLNRDTEAIYLQVSRDNIKAYEILQQRGVSTQEASKIVQYGHRGGGFMLVSLETLVNLSKHFEGNDDIPKEGKEIVKQLEDFVHSHGMEVIYESRKAAPRTGCPNPEIFHTRENFPHNLARTQSLTEPSLVRPVNFTSSPELEKITGDYLRKRQEIFSSPEKMKAGWKELLKEKEAFVGDFNDSLTALTFANTPWRVWGEVKRHRALEQTAESIYLAVERAKAFLFQSKQSELTPDYTRNFFSVPASVESNLKNMDLWIERIRDSIDTYDYLIRTGVKKSDAITIIPRGIKLGITKRFDFYNTTLGYCSLRSCSTVEPEMREITEREMQLIKSQLPKHMAELIGPKCMDVGFCSEPKCCGKVKGYLSFAYDEVHSEMAVLREQEIRATIERKK